MPESKIDKVLTQLRTDFEAYSHNQNNVIKAAEAKEAIEVIEGLLHALNPQQWSRAMVVAWDTNIPDLPAAFEALRDAAIPQHMVTNHVRND